MKVHGSMAKDTDKESMLLLMENKKFKTMIKARGFIDYFCKLTKNTHSV